MFVLSNATIGAVLKRRRLVRAAASVLITLTAFGASGCDSDFFDSNSTSSSRSRSSFIPGGGYHWSQGAQKAKSEDFLATSDPSADTASKLEGSDPLVLADDPLAPKMPDAMPKLDTIDHVEGNFTYNPSYRDLILAPPSDVMSSLRPRLNRDRLSADDEPSSDATPSLLAGHGGTLRDPWRQKVSIAAPAGPLRDLQRHREWAAKHVLYYNPFAHYNVPSGPNGKEDSLDLMLPDPETENTTGSSADRSH